MSRRSEREELLRAAKEMDREKARCVAMAKTAPEEYLAEQCIERAHVASRLSSLLRNNANKK